MYWKVSLVWPGLLSAGVFYEALELWVGILLTVSYLLWLAINVYRSLSKTGGGPDWSSLSKLASLLKKYYGRRGFEDWYQAFELLERLGDREEKTYVATKILNAKDDNELSQLLYLSESLASGLHDRVSGDMEERDEV